MDNSKALREALELCVGRLRAIARDIESGENLRDGIGVICQWANSAEQALAAAPASPVGSGASEPTNWKGVRWIDSIKASDLAEEIAQHFGHECTNCGEDADEDSCAKDWVESRLSNWLDEMASKRQSQPHAAVPSENTQKLIDGIAQAINRVSAENGSNTPDFILAEYLVRCLKAFDITSRNREKWYGKSLSIGGGE